MRRSVGGHGFTGLSHDELARLLHGQRLLIHAIDGKPENAGEYHLAAVIEGDTTHEDGVEQEDSKPDVEEVPGPVFATKIS